ncbi:hypothetical protein M422DRAFT_119940, partial [Sphaerobolus stellatus SS14]
VCGIFSDWYCFSMILLGIICNGLSCFVIGSGKLEFSGPQPSDHSPAGDGVLRQSPQHLIILKGTENAVTKITRNSFYLHYASGDDFNDIGYISLALTTQFLLQLFLVPQGKLFGQILFL